MIRSQFSAVDRSSSRIARPVQSQLYCARLCCVVLDSSQCGESSATVVHPVTVQVLGTPLGCVRVGHHLRYRSLRDASVTDAVFWWIRSVFHLAFSIANRSSVVPTQLFSDSVLSLSGNVSHSGSSGLSSPHCNPCTITLASGATTPFVFHVNASIPSQPYSETAAASVLGAHLALTVTLTSLTVQMDVPPAVTSQQQSFVHTQDCCEY